MHRTLMMALALLCLAPMTGLCQSTTQTQTNVPPGFPPDGATYQDPAMPTLPPGLPPQEVVPDMPGDADMGPADEALASSGPGTAAEQGYDPDMAALQETLRRQAEDHAAMNTARQLGLVVPVPRLLNPVSADPASHAWVSDWVIVLSGIGIPASKVHFEANRLARDDFAMWASRMVWAYGTPAQAKQMECCSP